MQQVRTRIIGALVVMAALATGLTISTSGVAAAPATSIYQCVGATNDQAVSVSQYLTRPAGWYSTDTFMSSIAGATQNVGVAFPRFPQMPVNFTGTAPSGAPVGQAIAASFTVAATLPQDLINASTHLLGQNFANVSNTTFDIDATNSTPDHVTGSLPNQTVKMVYNQPSTGMNAQVAGNFTATGSPGALVLFQPGKAHVELDWGTAGWYMGQKLLGGVWVPLYLTVFKLKFDCTPVSRPVIALSTIVAGGGGGSATTSTTAKPTTTTTTTKPTTTTSTLKPTTTTTTLKPTTTTSTTSPTLKPTTTTTTVKAPPGSPDALDVTISGAGYHAAGPVSGPGFSITTDPKTDSVSGVHGTGSITGPKGDPVSVTVSMDRMLNWTFGSISVSDPSSNIDLRGFRIFGGAIWRFGHSARVSGSWWTFDATHGLRPFTITAVVTDNA